MSYQDAFDIQLKQKSDIKIFLEFMYESIRECLGFD